MCLVAKRGKHIRWRRVGVLSVVFMEARRAEERVIRYRCVWCQVVVLNLGKLIKCCLQNTSLKQAYCAFG